MTESLSVTLFGTIFSPMVEISIPLANDSVTMDLLRTCFVISMVEVYMRMYSS